MEYSAMAQYKEGTFIHEESVNFNEQEWKCWKASNKTASWLNQFIFNIRIQYHLAATLGIVFKQQKGMNDAWMGSDFIMKLKTETKFTLKFKL